MGYQIKQSQTAQPLLFLMIDSTDHLAGKTGLSPTVTLSKNGGTFASPAGAVTEVGSGVYKVAGNATDAATLGPLWLHATATGADPCDERYDVVAYDPQATSLGLVLAKTTNITGFNDLSAAQVNAEVDTALADYDAPTNAEMVARTLATASYATATDQTAIKAKTDNLPSDPADASDIAASFTAISSTLTTIASYIDTEVAAIKAKTDGLPADPADASDIAALFATVNATLATIAGYIDTEIGAIKAKTDNLPASPAAVSNIPTAAQIRAEIDAFSTKLAQLAGAFTGSTSVFTVAALANAPSGGGGGGGVTLSQLQDELTTRYLTLRNVRAIAAILAGRVTENATHTASTFFDINDPTTPIVTSTNFATERTVTVN